MPRPVLIAGAGIGGLTLAIALARRRIASTVVERAPALAEIGAGIQLSPNASRVLDRLGLGPELDEAGVRPEAVRLIDGRTGKSLAHLPLDFAAEQRWGSPYRLIHRGRLQRILVNAALAAGVDLRLGTELVDFAAADHRVVAHLRTSDGDETIAAAALVGADGVQSAVRGRTEGATAPRFSGQIAWRATIHLPSRNETGVWLGPGAHLVTYPLDYAGELNLVAVTHGKAARDGWAQPGNRDELMRAFRNWSGPVQALLAAPGDWVKWPLYELAPSKNWGVGRVTLLGDAAHPTLPHMAQGAALAIEDAAVLTATLAEAPDDPIQAFRRYEVARMPRAAAVQAAARRNGQIFRLRGLPALARDTTLRMLGPDRLSARFDWLYGYKAC